MRKERAAVLITFHGGCSRPSRCGSLPTTTRSFARSGTRSKGLRVLGILPTASSMTTRKAESPPPTAGPRRARPNIWRRRISLPVGPATITVLARGTSTPSDSICTLTSTSSPPAGLRNRPRIAPLSPPSGRRPAI